MATLADIEEFQASVDDLTSASIGEFLAVWATLDLGDAAASTGILREVFAALVEQYGEMSAELGAQWFEFLRAEAAPPVAYEPKLSKVVISSAIKDRLGWAAYPLFQEEQDAGKAFARFSATLQNEVAQPSRDTIETNAREDPARPRWARHASANACAFCALLATRGAVYFSEATAQTASKYHPHCHCAPIAIWPSQEYEPAPWVANWEQGYKAARTKLETSDPKAILAEMRSTLGLK